MLFIASSIILFSENILYDFNSVEIDEICFMV